MPRKRIDKQLEILTKASYSSAIFDNDDSELSKQLNNSEWLTIFELFGLPFKVKWDNQVEMNCNCCENDNYILVNLSAPQYARYTCRSKCQRIYSDSLIGLLQLQTNSPRREIVSKIQRFIKKRDKRLASKPEAVPINKSIFRITK